MKRPLLAVLCALPLIGLAGSIGARQAERARASEWVIPVSGYDPRDVLRGHYLRFRYDWRQSGDAAMCEDQRCLLCLTGTPPDGGEVRIVGRGDPCEHLIDPAKSALRTVSTGGNISVTGRLFVPESEADALAAQLARTPMALSARLTRGGRLVNEALVPAPPTSASEPPP